MDIDRVVGANAHTGATSEHLVLNVRPNVLVVLLVLESARVDKLTDPRRLVVVFLAAAHLVTSSLLDILGSLRPAVRLNVAVQDWVLLRNNAELRVGDGAIYAARS